MKVEIIRNLTMGELLIHRRPGSWDYDWRHRSKQVLEIDVTATSLREVGHTVGLSQTLVHDTRHALYEGGLQWYGVTRQGLPCLDGDPDLEPWYDESSVATLDAIKKPVRLYMEDRPFLEPDRVVQSPNGSVHPLVGVDVLGDFIVSLLDINATKSIIRQWSWSSFYTLFRDPRNPTRSEVLIGRHKPFLQLEAEHPIVTTGPVADDGQMYIWFPDLWVPNP